MIPADETFNGTWPFNPQFTEAPGFRMHYVDEGEGEPIICLHGEPTWGYLYRNFIPPLSKTHRVIVPDHMGFGKSETPPDREYTLKTHVGNLAALVEELDLKDITLVIQDWGGPIGAAFTLRHPERVKRLFLMNTLCGYGALVEGAPKVPRNESPWFAWVEAALKDGSYEQVMSNLAVTTLSVMKQLIGFENSSVITPEWISAYSAPFRTTEDCKGAIEFPLDVVKNRIVSYVLDGRPMLDNLRSKPAMLAEGMKDRAILPEVAIADFKALFPNAPVVELPHAGHFCQEDDSDTLVALLQQFIQST
jgi:haloalkane dehalogenase